MKNPDRETVLRLDELPNIGKAMSDKFHSIGIDHPKKLIGKEPFEMYEVLCATSGERPDLCVIDVFMSVIHFMEGGDPLPCGHLPMNEKAYHPTNTKEIKKMKHGFSTLSMLIC